MYVQLSICDKDLKYTHKAYELSLNGQAKIFKYVCGHVPVGDINFWVGQPYITWFSNNFLPREVDVGTDAVGISHLINSIIMTPSIINYICFWLFNKLLIGRQLDFRGSIIPLYPHYSEIQSSSSPNKKVKNSGATCFGWIFERAWDLGAHGKNELRGVIV